MTDQHLPDTDRLAQLEYVKRQLEIGSLLLNVADLHHRTLGVHTRKTMEAQAVHLINRATKEYAEMEPESLRDPVTKSQKKERKRSPNPSKEEKRKLAEKYDHL